MITVIENPDEIKRGALQTALVAGAESVIVPYDLFEGNENFPVELARRKAIAEALTLGRNYNPIIETINGRKFLCYELVR